MAAVIGGAIRTIKEGWEDQQRLDASESIERRGRARLSNVDNEFVVATEALKKLKLRETQNIGTGHLPRFSPPGSSQGDVHGPIRHDRKAAGPAWIEADQQEYESNDDDDDIVGNEIPYVRERKMGLPYINSSPAHALGPLPPRILPHSTICTPHPT